ncbi:hypothetical protein Pan44_52090 [Caulifigura coniformis]|uniref:DUF433 domain-containing protein n=1 Tax=Caulifigura coniformis TaxID=2527983 RepID=A0A517SLY5_9PLAN|nr:DUF433 domain-containing protein [Caulifigura coniformis]QDT57142.1 hypothetical protein Pan44_52090 [Caulifigura coniformis]
MSDDNLLKRIVQDPKVMAGQPVIKGTRLTVRFVLNVLAHGTSVDELLLEYDGLAVEDLQACFLFASESLGDVEFMPLVAEAS